MLNYGQSPNTSIKLDKNLKLIKLIQSKQYGEEDTNGKRIDDQATH